MERIPPITGLYLTGSILLSLLVSSNLISPLSLFFSVNSVKTEPFRLITTFLYSGSFSLDYLFHLFFFFRYSALLEQSYNYKSDYIWLLLIVSSTLLLLSPLSPTPFLSSSLSFSLVYLWARLNPTIRLSLFGIITITAPYLPICLCLFSWALTTKSTGLSLILSDGLGLLAGHWYYFFNIVWKRERASNQSNWLQTPRFLSVYLLLSISLTLTHSHAIEIIKIQN